MKTCLACRARLKAFREAPARVAALVPPAVMAASDGGGSVRALVESALGAAQHKAAVFGERAQAAAELMSAQKVAAVAASGAALAGGTAVDQFANHYGPPHPAPPAERVDAKPVEEETPVQPTTAPAPVTEQAPATEPAPPPAPAPEPPSPPPPPPPAPANEFAPAGNAPAAATAPTPAAAPPQPAGGEYTSGGGGGAQGGGGAGEFAP